MRVGSANCRSSRHDRIPRIGEGAATIRPLLSIRRNLCRLVSRTNLYPLAHSPLNGLLTQNYSCSLTSLGCRRCHSSLHNRSPITNSSRGVFPKLVGGDHIYFAASRINSLSLSLRRRSRSLSTSNLSKPTATGLFPYCGQDSIPRPEFNSTHIGTLRAVNELFDSIRF